MTGARLPEDNELLVGMMEEKGLKYLPDESALITALSDNLRRGGVEDVTLERAVEEAVHNGDTATIEIFVDELHLRLVDVSPLYTKGIVREVVEQVLPGFQFLTDEGEFHEVDAEGASNPEDDEPKDLDFS